MSDGTYENILLWLITIAAPGQTLFVLIYGLRSPWYKSLLGRALFTKSLALALLLDISLVGHWWPTYPGQKPIGIVVVGLVLIGAWMQLVALIHEKLSSQPDRFGGRPQPVENPVETRD